MTEKLILLPTGDALRSDGDPSRDVRREAADANAVTASVDARVIVVAGPKDSGKTTLVSSLYQQFLMNQQFAHFSFVSSRTLRAWELRCRLARVSSGGLSPDSARTLVAEEGNFLHLRLRGVESSDTVDLLLSDWPYETFRQARNSLAYSRDLPAIRRADCITLLLDGENLADHAERQVERQNIVALLRSLLDAEVVGGWTNVLVVTTKWDYVAASAERAAIESFGSDTVRQLRLVCGSRVARVDYRQVAAISETPGMPPGHGLCELLQAWTTYSAQYTPTGGPPPERASTRQFDQVRWAT